MKTYLIFVALVLGVWACGGNEQAAASSSGTAVTAVDAPDGAKIYKTYCVACHGLYGDMGASGAFNLQTSALAVEERVQVITKGRNVMTPFESILTAEQIQAVAAYTMTLKK
jgi:mono/diheme cytochrome c family protein